MKHVVEGGVRESGEGWEEEFAERVNGATSDGKFRSGVLCCMDHVVFCTLHWCGCVSHKSRE